MGNSLDSLRLLWWARERGLDQEALADLLGSYHFEQRKCVAARSTQLAACEALRFPIDEACEVLDDASRFRAEVEGSIAASQRGGHHSIPVFVFTAGAASLAVQGAADVEEYKGVLRRLASRVSTSQG